MYIINIGANIYFFSSPKNEDLTNVQTWYKHFKVDDFEEDIHFKLSKVHIQCEMGKNIWKYKWANHFDIKKLYPKTFEGS